MPKGVPRDQSTSHRISHRLRIARGHLEKVIAMVEQGEYCIDIIHQSQAVQQALKETDTVILENHLRTCTAEAIRKGNSEAAVNELMQLFMRKR